MYRKILLCIGLFFCLSGCQPAEKTSFSVVPTAGYIALPDQSEWTFTLAISDNLPDAESLQFIWQDTVSPVRISDYETTPAAEKDQYDSLHLTVQATEQGIGICTGLRLLQPDGTHTDYAIGRICFDVDQAAPDTPSLDFYSSPAVCSSADDFPYAWSRTGQNIAVTAIQYGEKLIITEPAQIKDGVAEPDGLPMSGKIPLAAYDAPFVYIKAKITVKTPEGTHIEYANGCYCGTDFAQRQATN